MGLTADAKGKDVLYLLDVISLKLQIPDVRAAIKAQDKQLAPAAVLVVETRPRLDKPAEQFIIDRLNSRAIEARGVEP